MISHLTSNESVHSDLIKLMQKGICFTTVINASELLYAAENESQTKVIRDVLNAMKVLGLNSRYALKIPELKNKAKRIRDILIIIVAKSNNLPIITYEKSRYDGVEIEIYHPEEVGG
jgi:predicted nucleic acid-binding protein